MSEQHCSYWGGIPQDKQTDFTRLAIDILVRSFKTGVYNLPINWERVDWRYGDKGVKFTIFTSGLSTFDFDQLTSLVFAAHDECVRIQISPASFQYLRIIMSPRASREGSMYDRHPTLEDALSEFRKVKPYRAIEAAEQQGREAEREACANLLREMTKSHSALRLALGEMSSQEMRTLKSGLELGSNRIRARGQS